MGFGENSADAYLWRFEFYCKMNARTRALQFVVFSYFLLASRSLWSEESKGAIGYNPTDGQASASLLGASPSLKTPSPVHGLCWSNNNGLFALTEQNAVFMRDGYDSHLIHSIAYDGAVSLQFAYDVVTQSDMFMALSKGGKFSVWNFNDLPADIMISGDVPPSYSVQLAGDKRVTASAFSHSGNHMAVAFDDGSINMSIVLHYTQKISDKELSGHLGNVFALDFSRNDGFLASSGLDDKIIIWHSSDGGKVNVLPFYSGSGAGALFNSDSASIISLEKPDLITIRAFDGSRLMEIEPNGSGVKDLKMTSNGRNLVALTADDNLEFYDLSTGQYVGYVPPFNQTSLTSFAFNSDDSVLLTGHADGSVYKLRLENVFLKPEQKAPKKRVVAPEEVVEKGSQYTERVGEKPKKEPEPETQAEPFDSQLAINLGLAGRMLPSPFTFAVDIDAKVRYQLNQVFYFGGGLAFGLGFPKKDFPYSYTLNGKKYDAPYFLNGSVYGSAGFVVSFKNKKAPYLFFELDPGVRFERLYQNKNGAVVTTKWRPAFAIDAMVGLGWKYFEVGGGLDFDTILGLKPRAIVCGKIPIPLKPKGGKKVKKSEARI